MLKQSRLLDGNEPLKEPGPRRPSRDLPPANYEFALIHPMTGTPPEEQEEIDAVAEVVQAVARQFDIALSYPPGSSGGDTRFGPGYAEDRRRIAGASGIVAVITSGSCGIGMEIEIASNEMIPVLVLAPVGTPLTRMVRDASSVCGIIEYDLTDLDTLESDLYEIMGYIETLAALVDERRRAILGVAFGPRLRARRESLGLSLEALADRIPVAADEVRRMEEAPLGETNPSLLLLARIAEVLDVDITYFLPEASTVLDRVLSQDLAERGGPEALVIAARDLAGHGLRLSARDRRAVEIRYKEWRVGGSHDI